MIRIHTHHKNLVFFIDQADAPLITDDQVQAQIGAATINGITADDEVIDTVTEHEMKACRTENFRIAQEVLKHIKELLIFAYNQGTQEGVDIAHDISVRLVR